MNTSLGVDYFDTLYAGNADPWRFETSAYEHAKYEATIAALPRQRYRRGIEIGCSIGVLTEQLSASCDHLLGIDIAEAAIAAARQRCARLANVEFARLQMPETCPDGAFDLIMLSEVLYYFSPVDVDAMAEVVTDIALPAADIMLVHWLGPTPDYPMTADTAVDRFLATLGDRVVVTLQQRQPDYRLDLLQLA